MTTLRANESFTAYDRKNGEMRSIAVGALVDSNDSVVKGRESLFTKVDEYVEKYGRRDRKTVERASAEPGEKRSIGAPRVEEKPADKKDEKADDKPAARSLRTTSTTGAKGKQDGEV